MIRDERTARNSATPTQPVSQVSLDQHSPLKNQEAIINCNRFDTVASEPKLSRRSTEPLADEAQSHWYSKISTYLWNFDVDIVVSGPSGSAMFATNE